MIEVLFNDKFEGFRLSLAIFQAREVLRNEPVDFGHIVGGLEFPTGGTGKPISI